MFSVFSNIKPSEQIDLLRTCAGGSMTRILIAGPEDEPLYMLKPAVTSWLQWINNKILFILPDADLRTIGVRIRIATGMLNNIEKNGILPKDICIAYHDRLVENVNRWTGLILTEDLPF